MGEFGIIGCGGPPELDTPLEDGKGDSGAGGEEDVIRFAGPVFP